MASQDGNQSWWAQPGRDGPGNRARQEMMARVAAVQAAEQRRN